MSKALADDAEEYVKKAKQRATPTGQTMEKLNSMKDQEIQETMKKIELFKVQKALQEAQSGTGVSANVVVAKLFEGKSIEEINTMLSNMTPEAVNNLVALARNLDTNPVNAIMRQGQGQPQQTGDQMLLQYLLKRADEKPVQQGLTAKDVVEIVKMVGDMRQPAQVSQSSGGMSSAEMLKLVLEFNRPLYDQLKSKDKEVMDARLKEMEAKMPGDLSDQIKYVKEMAPMLGITGNATNELDLKLEDMRENREVDMKRLDWEQEKWKMESEADLNKWEQIGKILQGPVGDVVKQMGSAGADRVRGSGARPVGRTPKPIQTQCPNCEKVIYVDAEAETALCGNCGAVLQKQGAGAVPPAQPAPTRVEEPAPAQQPAEPAQEEQEEEEEEKEPESNEKTKQPTEPATPS